MRPLAVQALEAIRVNERDVTVVEVDQAFAAELSDQAADGLAGEAGHTAEFLVSYMGWKAHGEMISGAGVTRLVRLGPVQQGAGQLAGCGCRQGKAAGRQDGATEIARQRLHG